MHVIALWRGVKPFVSEHEGDVGSAFVDKEGELCALAVGNDVVFVQQVDVDRLVFEGEGNDGDEDFFEAGAAMNFDFGSTTDPEASIVGEDEVSLFLGGKMQIVMGIKHFTTSPGMFAFGVAIILFDLVLNDGEPRCAVIAGENDAVISVAFEVGGNPFDMFRNDVDFRGEMNGRVFGRYVGFFAIVLNLVEVV